MNHSLPRAPSARCPLSPGPPSRHECMTAFPEVPRPGKMGPEELKTKWVSPLGESDTGERQQGQELPAQPVLCAADCFLLPMHRPTSAQSGAPLLCGP